MDRENTSRQSAPLDLETQVVIMSCYETLQNLMKLSTSPKQMTEIMWLDKLIDHLKVKLTQ